MFSYIFMLFALCTLWISVFAAKGGGLINKDEQFIKVQEGKWLNTSIILQSSEFFSDENLLVNLLAVYGNDDFLEFGSLVGMDNAIDCLELDTRSSDILASYFNASNKLNERADVYQQQIPTYQLVSGSPSRQCRNMEIWSSWMRCYVDPYFSKATVYACGIVQYIYGTATSPSTYKTAWNMAADGRLGNALGVVGIGLAFKSTDAKEKCTSAFLVVNEKFGLVSAGGTEQPAFLFGVIPKNKKGGDCRTATSESGIDEMATILLQGAMKREMVAFCLTFTGQSGWFGSNNWYGQVKVYPMVDSGSVSYASIPCLEYISEGGSIAIVNWMKEQYNANFKQL